PDRDDRYSDRLSYSFRKVNENTGCKIVRGNRHVLGRLVPSRCKDGIGARLLSESGDHRRVLHPQPSLDKFVTYQLHHHRIVLACLLFDRLDELYEKTRTVFETAPEFVRPF